MVLNVNLGKAWHQGLMSEKIQPLTDSITTWALYEFVRIMFGLSQAPGAFQRFLERVIGSDLREVVAIPYLDNVICFSKTFDEHLEHLRNMFQRFKESCKTHIRKRSNKCSFRHPYSFSGLVTTN